MALLSEPGGKLTNAAGEAIEIPESLRPTIQ